jgi:hypothetical protein
MAMTISGTNGLTYPDASTETSASIGYGQTWQDVGPTGTNARVSGTTYTNSTGRPIMVTAGGQAVSGSPNIAVVVAGVTIISWSFPYGTGQPVTFIVPVGATYSITFASGTTLNRWAELR